MSSLPEPFKLVEGELQPFSDSIAELVSSDQPILSMAAKVREVFFLLPRAAAAVVKEAGTRTKRLAHVLTIQHTHTLTRTHTNSTSSKSAMASASAPPSSS